MASTPDLIVTPRHWWATFLVAALCGACSGDDETTPPKSTFRNVASDVGVGFETHHWSEPCLLVDSGGGPGVCMFDYDHDDDMDLFFTDRAPHGGSLYRNEGGVFVNATEESGLASTDDSVGCLAFDYDGDADEDLLVTNFGASRLYRNDDAMFVDVTQATGIVTEAFNTSATAGDMDGDGDLDLYIGRHANPTDCPACEISSLIDCPGDSSYLFENQGGTFVDVTAERGVSLVEQTYAAMFADFDLDNDLDLFVGNDTGQLYPDHLYVNDGSGTFVDDQGSALYHFGSATMGVAMGDLDDNGLDDLVITDFKGFPTRVFLGDDGRFLTSAVDPISAKYVHWGVGLHDFDGDHDLDLLQANGGVNPRQDPWAQTQLFLNDGTGWLAYYDPVSDSDPLSEIAGIGRGIAFGDLDNDGDVDAVVARGGATPQVLINDAFQGNYLGVKLNTLAAGARVVVTAGGRTSTRRQIIGGSYLGSSDPRLFFTLGDATEGDVEVIWLDGQTSSQAGVAANQVIEIEPP